MHAKALHLLERVRGKIALATSWADLDRNVVNDDHVVSFAITSGHALGHHAPLAATITYLLRFHNAYTVMITTLFVGLIFRTTSTAEPLVDRLVLGTSIPRLLCPSAVLELYL